MSVPSAPRRGLASLAAWVYPDRCALCDRIGEPPVCPRCRAAFVPLRHPQLDTDGPLSFRIALFEHSGRAAQAVRRLKFDRVTALADPLARLVAEGYERFGLDAFELVVPVPIHWIRRSFRGFNQSVLLAERLPHDRVRPELLSRVRFTRPQVGLSPEERVRNVEGAFRASSAVKERSVLLLDDVFTSGGTSRECARVLREAGAAEVAALTLTGFDPRATFRNWKD